MNGSLFRTVELDLRPHTYGASDVKDIRKLLGVSQPLFAKFLGVDLGTVRSWEQGQNPPSPMACRFMDEIRSSPDHWKGRLNQAIKTKSRPKVVS
jgi:putative transcriptional regulator